MAKPTKCKQSLVSTQIHKLTKALQLPRKYVMVNEARKNFQVSSNDALEEEPGILLSAKSFIDVHKIFKW
jgi:hypothetical protein